MKKLIFTAVFIAYSALADEYGYFYATTNSPAASVTLHAGDRLVLLANRGSATGGGAVLVITLPDGHSISFDPTISGSRQISSDGVHDRYFASGDEESRTVCGPCTVTVEASYSGVYAAYRIVRAATAAIQPNNVISLPADPNGDMQVIVETSTDLLTWDQVYSFALFPHPGHSSPVVGDSFQGLEDCR